VLELVTNGILQKTKIQKLSSVTLMEFFKNDVIAKVLELVTNGILQKSCNPTVF